MQRQINLAAVRFLIVFESEERRHVEDYSDNKDRARTTAKWARHFSVARTFKGFGKLSECKKQEEYQKICSCLQRFSGDAGDARRVLDFEVELKRTLEIESSLLSAATKLLWLVDKRSVIYDSKLVKALELPANHEYQSYLLKWRGEFTELSPLIKSATASLATFESHFPTEWDLTRDTQEDWFCRRVFDNYQWHRN